VNAYLWTTLGLVARATIIGRQKHDDEETSGAQHAAPQIEQATVPDSVWTHA
jgi:hypothetical protein